MVIHNLDYVQEVSENIQGGAVASSFATATNLIGFAFAATDNTATFFVADSDSFALAVGVGNTAAAGGFAISTI